MNDDTNYTKLHRAAGQGRKEIVELLIANGADINDVNDEKDTPLHMAALMGEKEIVELLIANGADINAVDDANATPLLWAAQKGHKEIVELLIANGAAINGAGDITPLEIAEHYGHEDIVALLVAQKKWVRIKRFMSKFRGNLGGPNKSILVENKRSEQMSFDELVEELVGLCQNGYYWGRKNGFPVMEEYPQYNDVRRIGERIFDISEISGMQHACQILLDRVIVEEGGGQYLAEHSWRGIGGWQP